MGLDRAPQKAKFIIPIVYVVMGAFTTALADPIANAAMWLTSATIGMLWIVWKDLLYMVERWYTKTNSTWNWEKNFEQYSIDRDFFGFEVVCLGMLVYKAVPQWITITQ